MKEVILPTVFIYPALTDQLQANDLVSRLAWYMSPYLDKIGSILLTCPNYAWIAGSTLAPHMATEIEELISPLISKIRIVPESDLVQRVLDGDRKRDVFMLVDSRAEKTMSQPLTEAKAGYTANAGFYRVDPVRTRQEGSFFLWAGLNKFSEPKVLIEKNRLRLAEMAAEVGHFPKAFVFGTGPSFSEYVESHEFDGDLCIVANSIVKNKSAMDKLKPRIICAADPIYHAGCSSYAGAFRQALLEALEQTGAWFVCPLRDSGIYRAFLPEKLADRMVCVPFDSKVAIPTDLTVSFHINPFPNVLTLLLLPLAATFSDSIHVVGCDGRRLLDDSFFWSHDKKVQFNDQMAEIQAAHPGFFAIDYNDYYLDHCRDLEKVIVALEEAGRVVVSDTPSLIPALNARERRDSAKGLCTFVMIDPDAKDDWGHFLAYDARLASAAKEAGVDFYIICRKELEERFRPSDCAALIRVFTVNSWTIGNKKPAERANLLRFATELDEGIRRIEAIVASGDICLFFYVGSLEAAELIEFLLAEHPRLHAVVNLFWSYAHDQKNLEYIERWRLVARRINAHPRLHLMHSTEQIANEFRDDWNIELPVLEHPSTTFSDTIARQLAAGRIAVRSSALETRFRIVFPGGARAEKGFVLSVGTVDRLRGAAGLDIVLRARVDQVSGAVLKKAYDGLDKSGIEILDADLSDHQFIDMIEGADIVVIPYLADAFRRRTSGILVDAMLLGKPVVVLQDTWLADVVKAEEIGVCASPTVDGIVAAISEVVDNYDRFLASIERSRIAYLERNSWRSLIQSVFKIASPGILRNILSADLARSRRREVLPVPLGHPSNTQLELDQLRKSFADLTKYAEEMSKRLDGGSAVPGELADGVDMLERWNVVSDYSSARLLLTSVGSGLLTRSEEMRARLKTDSKLQAAVTAALAALPDGDPHKVQFVRVRERFAK